MTPVLEVMNSASVGLVLALLNGFLLAVAVAAAVWIALRITPQINAGTRHVIWWTALAVVMVAPVAPVVFELSSGDRVTFHDSVVPGFEDSAPLPAIVGVNDPDPVRPDFPEHWQAPLRLNSTAGIQLALAGWIVLILLQLRRIWRSFLYLRSLKSTAFRAAREDQLRFDEWRLACRVDRPVRLLISQRIASPMAAGFLHPAVILPESLAGKLSEPEIDHILLHELAHIARRDDWTNLAARLATAALVLHPVALWILRRIDREREIACDDWVVAATGQARPYAESLARLFELCAVRRRELLATGMAERASQLRERIEILLHRRRGPRPSRPRVAVTVAILACFVVGAASSPPWIALAQDPPRPAAPAPVPTPRPPSRVAPRASSDSAPRVATTQPAQPAQPAVPAAANRGSLLAALVAAGYGDLSVDEIIQLKNHGVSAAFITGIKESGWGKLTANQLVLLRTHSVTPDFLSKLRQTPYGALPVEEIVQLRDGGVTVDELASSHALGFGPYSARQLIDLHNSGVRAPLYLALKEAGFSKLEPREIIEVQNHGLRAEHFREAKSYGPNLTLKQIIKLKTAGVI